jgi:hypothetical protein
VSRDLAPDPVPGRLSVRQRTADERDETAVCGWLTRRALSAIWRIVGGKDCFLGCYSVGMGLFKISSHEQRPWSASPGRLGRNSRPGHRIASEDLELRRGWARVVFLVLQAVHGGAPSHMSNWHSSSVGLWV